MKNFCLTILFTFLSMCTYAQEQVVCNVEFSRDDCLLTKTDGVYSITPVSSELRMIDDATKPAIPCKKVNVLIPFGQK